jgi:WD40 repeat protein
LLTAANHGGSHNVSVFNVKPAPNGLSLLGVFPTGFTNENPYSVAFRPPTTMPGPAGLLVAANWTNDNTLSVFRLSKSGAVWSVGTAKSFSTGVPASIPASGPEEVAFHPSGNYLATANFNHGSVSVFYLKDSTVGLLSVVSAGLQATVVHTLAFSSKGDQLLIGTGLHPNVLLFKFSTSSPYLTPAGAPVSTGAASGETRSVAFSPINSQLVAAASGNSVSLMTVNPGGVLTVEPGSPFPIAGNPGPRSVAFHPGGKLLAVGTGNWMSASAPVVSMLTVG